VVQKKNHNQKKVEQKKNQERKKINNNMQKNNQKINNIMPKILHQLKEKHIMNQQKQKSQLINNIRIQLHLHQLNHMQKQVMHLTNNQKKENQIHTELELFVNKVGEKLKAFHLATQLLLDVWMLKQKKISNIQLQFLT